MPYAARWRRACKTRCCRSCIRAWSPSIAVSGTQKSPRSVEAGSLGPDLLAKVMMTASKKGLFPPRRRSICGPISAPGAILGSQHLFHARELEDVALRAQGLHHARFLLVTGGGVLHDGGDARLGH